MLNSQKANSTLLRDFYLNQLENTKNPIQVDAILNTLDLLNQTAAEIDGNIVGVNTVHSVQAEQA